MELVNATHYSQRPRGRTIYGRWTLEVSTSTVHLTSDPTSDLLQIDQDTYSYLLEKRVINWCHYTSPLYPVKTPGDGNCLLHAVSMYMFSHPDENTFLRSILYKNMASYCGGQEIRSRWQKHREWHNSLIPDGGLTYSEEEWDREWNLLVSAASPACRTADAKPSLLYDYLEPLHVFILANSILRPIIILGEPYLHSLKGERIEHNDFVGIYLPLLWDPFLCHSDPVILAFRMDHFSPLLYRVADDAESSCSSRRLYAVPLVAESLEQLRVHFLTPDEEGLAPVFLQQYLRLFELEQSGHNGLETVLLANVSKTSFSDAGRVQLVEAVQETKNMCALHTMQISLKNADELVAGELEAAIGRVNSYGIAHDTVFCATCGRDVAICGQRCYLNSIQKKIASIRLSSYEEIASKMSQSATQWRQTLNEYNCRNAMLNCTETAVNRREQAYAFGGVKNSPEHDVESVPCGRKSLPGVNRCKTAGCDGARVGDNLHVRCKNCQEIAMTRAARRLDTSPPIDRSERRRQLANSQSTGAATIDNANSVNYIDDVSDETVRTCVGPSCGRIGRSELTGLCAKCFSLLQTVNGNKYLTPKAMAKKLQSLFTTDDSYCRTPTVQQQQSEFTA